MSRFGGSLKKSKMKLRTRDTIAMKESVLFYDISNQVKKTWWTGW